MPAEWEPHRATWIGWPHHEPDWPGKLGPIPWVYAEIARVLAEHEPVEILCHDDGRAASARKRRSTRTASGRSRPPARRADRSRAGCATRRRPASTTRPATSCCSTGGSTRGRSTTTGGSTRRSARPIARVTGTSRASEPRRADTRRAHRPRRRRHRGQRPRAAARHRGVAAQRRPGPQSRARRAPTTSDLREWLGIRQTIWLGEGCVGDDTHGHVDDIARFVGADTIVLAVEEDPARREPRALDGQPAPARAASEAPGVGRCAS